MPPPVITRVVPWKSLSALTPLTTPLKGLATPRSSLVAGLDDALWFAPPLDWPTPPLDLLTPPLVRMAPILCWDTYIGMQLPCCSNKALAAISVPLVSMAVNRCTKRPEELRLRVKVRRNVSVCRGGVISWLARLRTATRTAESGLERAGGGRFRGVDIRFTGVRFIWRGVCTSSDGLRRCLGVDFAVLFLEVFVGVFSSATTGLRGMEDGEDSVGMVFLPANFLADGCDSSSLPESSMTSRNTSAEVLAKPLAATCNYVSCKINILH